MKRNDFGLWGVELSTEDFARALATFGIYQHSGGVMPHSVDAIKGILATTASHSKGLLGWSLSQQPPEKLTWMGDPSGLAQTFARAWEGFKKSYSGDLRFELVLDKTEDYFWLAEQFRSPAVGATSVYVRADEPQVEVGWNWPLRIGFLSGDESVQLRQLLERALRSSGLLQLATFINLERAEDDCDLLLMPQGLRGALSELLKAAWRPRADCVLVLGGSRELSSRTAALINAVRAWARTSGVGLLFGASDRWADWFNGLMAELAHNNPLDVALFRANTEVNAPPPLLVAARRLIDLSLVSISAERLGRTVESRVERAGRSGMPQFGPPEDMGIIITGGGGGGGDPEPPGEVSTPARPRGATRSARRSAGGSKGGGGRGAVFRGGKGGSKRSAGRTRPPFESVMKGGEASMPPRMRDEAMGVAEALRREFPVDHWMHETGAATDTAARAREAQEILDKIPQQPEDRRILAEVCEALDRKPEQKILKPDTAYTVDVSIGTGRDDKVSADVSFPYKDLTPSDKGHDLVVLFTEPRLSPDPQVGRLHLPPRGDSEGACRFFFHTGSPADAIRARISVLHENRVIQTAILEAPVADGGAKKKGGITLKVEARVLPDINALQGRQNFDAALILNHTPEGQPLVTAAAGEQAMMFSFDSTTFQQTINVLNGQLSELAEGAEEDFKEDLGDEKTTRLLNMLASNGRLLYRHLFEFRREGQWLLDKNKKKIQIVSTRPESNLPLEFLYDYEAPDLKAKLCQYAKESLPTGQCNKSCGGLKNKKNVVCPLGFWGLNRVIERHAYDDRVKIAGDVGLTAADPRREPLRVLDKALFAASGEVDRAKAGTIKSVEKVLSSKTKRGADYVMSWKEWAAKVRTESPSLLVLLSHTEVGATEGFMPALEISKLPRLRSVDINDKYVLKKGAKTKPVVMLIGCKTNAPDNLLESFVPFFRNSGAAIVLSTGATVLALQAAKVATELVRALSEVPKSGGVTFGDVMLQVRRKLLAKGVPMVLCLSAYGDADCVLE
jgi:hypothetical protein